MKHAGYIITIIISKWMPSVGCFLLRNIVMQYAYGFMTGYLIVKWVL